MLCLMYIEITRCFFLHSIQHLYFFFKYMIENLESRQFWRFISFIPFKLFCVFQWCCEVAKLGFFFFSFLRFRVAQIVIIYTVNCWFKPDCYNCRDQGSNEISHIFEVYSKSTNEMFNMLQRF